MSLPAFKFRQDHVLRLLQKHAPTAPLGQCLSLADEYQNLHDENYYLKSIIAILSTRLLNDNGAIKLEFVDGRPAWQFAMQEVQQCNAWVCCGPVSNPMNRFLEEFDQKAEEKGIRAKPAVETITS